MCLLFSLINNLSVFRTILEKIGLQGKVTPLQAKKKWDNLKKYIKYVHVILNILYLF